MKSSEDQLSPHIPKWRYFVAPVATVLFGWAGQVVTIGVVVAYSEFDLGDNAYVQRVAVLFYPLLSYFALAYLTGLLYAFCWTMTSRNSDALSRELSFLWFLILLPALMFACCLSLLAYLITISTCQAGLRYGLSFWPTKPWEVWLGQRPPDPPARHSRS